MKTSIAALIVFYTGSCLAQEDLSLHLKTGGEYILSTSKKHTITQTVDGKETSSINIEKGRILYKVVQDLDSFYVTEAKNKLFSQQVTTEAGTVFHSSDSSTTTESAIMHQFIDQPYEVCINKDLSIRSMRNFDSVIYYGLKKFNLTEEQLNGIMAQLQKDLSTAMNNQFASFSAIYPSKKVMPDEVWTVTTAVDEAVPATGTSEYSISTIMPGLLVLTGKGTVNSLDSEMVNENTVTRYHLTGSMKSVTKLDRQTHWIVDMEMTTVMSGYADIREEGSEVVTKVPLKMIIEEEVNGY